MKFIGRTPREGINVANAWRLFERPEEQRSQYAGILGYFSTHPAAEDRIAQLRGKALIEGWPLIGERVPIAF